MSKLEINRLIESLQIAFDGETWYGESLMDKLDQIDCSFVNSLPLNLTNSIAKLVQHLINWRQFAIEKLKGNEGFDIELNTVEDWTEVYLLTEEDWEQIKEVLRATQVAIIALLNKETDAFLDRQTPGKSYNYRFLIEGIIQHDIYHLGQIGIVAKQVVYINQCDLEKTKIAIDIFDDCAVEYQEKLMDLSLYQDSLDLFCTLLKKPAARILELACGPGNITQYLLKKQPDSKVLATDLAPTMLELAKKNNPTASFQLLNSKNLDQLTEKYNAVVAGFLLPYLSKAEAINWIYNLTDVLEEDGLVFMSTMEAPYEDSGWKGSSSNTGKKAYIHYHEATYLVETLEKNKFTILNLERKKIFTGGNEGIDLLIIAQKTN